MERMDAFVCNEDYEDYEEDFSTDTDNESTNVAAEEKVVSFAEEKPRELFAYWKVADEKYKLKLTPDEIMELERVYKRNLVNLMGDMDHMPSLTTMLQITHAAMKKWHHGVKLQHVKELYDKYITGGGSQLQFYVEVFIKIYAVSGFFSSAMATEIAETMDEAAAEM